MKNKKITNQYLKELYSDKEFPFPFCQNFYRGFDVRETFDYDVYFIHHLYMVLRYYQDHVAEIVDLEFHKITIKNKTNTLLNWIEEMIKDCKEIIHEWECCRDENLIQDTVDDLFEILSKCLYYLWW